MTIDGSGYDDMIKVTRDRWDQLIQTVQGDGSQAATIMREIADDPIQRNEYPFNARTSGEQTEPE